MSQRAAGFTLIPGQEGDGQHDRADVVFREASEEQWEVTLSKRVGKEEVAVAGEHSLQPQQHEVHQGPHRQDGEGKEGVEGNSVVREQCVVEHEQLLPAVQVVGLHGVSEGGEKVWLDLELGRQEEVLAEEPLLEEGEDEVPQAAERQRREEGEAVMQGELFVGEQDVLEGKDRTQVQGVLGDWEAKAEADVKHPEEKPVAEEQAEPGNSGQCTWSPLKALEALQLEMESMNEQAHRAFSRLRHRAYQRQRPYLQLRSTYIQCIRGFWSTVFVHHPMFSAMIKEQDQNVLKHMTNVKVEEDSDCCTIMLFFRRNPYFCNNVIVKEYLVTIRGYKALKTTFVEWKEHYARNVCFLRHHNSGLNFFRWLSDHNLAGSGWIAEIIIKDLWRNPLKYYQRTKAPGEGSERRRGEETPDGPTTVCCQATSEGGSSAEAF